MKYGDRRLNSTLVLLGLLLSWMALPSAAVRRESGILRLSPLPELPSEQAVPAARPAAESDVVLRPATSTAPVRMPAMAFVALSTPAKTPVKSSTKVSTKAATQSQGVSVAEATPQPALDAMSQPDSFGPYVAPSPQLIQPLKSPQPQQVEESKAAYVKSHVKQGVKRGLAPVKWTAEKIARQDFDSLYSPLTAVAIFPVMHHYREKAFGDLPLAFASEFANQMEAKAPGTKVLNPNATIEELRIRGMDGLYDRMVDSYVQTGRPDPGMLGRILRALSEDGTPIERVIFVDATVDFTTPAAPGSMLDKFKGWMTDGVPKELQYRVRSRVQAFDSLTPNLARVWDFHWNKSVPDTGIMNVTTSVYDDSDSAMVFGRASQVMSREILFLAPKNVYMHAVPKPTEEELAAQAAAAASSVQADVLGQSAKP